MFINKIREIVKAELSCSAHDLSHINRVYENCIYIAENIDEKVDMTVLEIAALMHDIARVREDNDKDHKIDHALLGAEMAMNILKDFDLSEEQRKSICEAIKTHRYRGANVPQTIEAKILFDADKLDSVGAIGIARCYMFAGQFKQSLYNGAGADGYVDKNITGVGRVKDYSKNSPDLEFEIKLKHVSERLFTALAKEIAEKRILCMSAYFDELKGEMLGEL